MKDYRRSYPLFSLCGLNCGLCPMRLGGYCPGCGGGEGHQPCAVIRCGRDHGNPAYCYECAAFPCPRLEELSAYDSFLTHRRMIADLQRAKEIGIDAYQLELAEKIRILDRLLARYNDGRKKTLFCLAVTLFDLKTLEKVMAKLEKEAGEDMSLKERGALAARYFQDAAKERGIELKLHKKKK
ncbi:DUF3795 domain-containing protein [Zongyangia hominis]|uniref:DUF3795 domain-containing protein n=1 Tax=Zongyangia hominis TaxID=2763677 RepID=A0A926E9C2_9FIRM|nr:DUF3795 domain-containing protein [Zongyangia hominis]MBC8570305.1 DUF3795 domain-containing protein [Zongyangia hominis]